MSTNLNTSLLKQISFDNQEVRTLLIDGTQIWLNHFEKQSYIVASENDRETKSSYIGPNYGPHPELTYEPLEPVPGFQFIYDENGVRYEIRNIHGSVYSSYSDEYKNEGKIASGHVFHLDQLVFFDDGENSVQTTVVSMSGSVVCLNEPLGNRLCIDLNNIPKNWYIDFPDGVDADLDGVDASIDIDDNDPLIGRYAYVTIEPTTIDGHETINGELVATKGFLPNMLVKIQANPVEEKEFDSWITNDINLMPEEARNPLLQFTMPPRHVTITPSYVDVGGRQRRFLLDSSEQDTERGTVEDLKFGSYLATEEVFVVATPKNGYKFTKWETENANVYEEENPQTKLIMPKSDVKLKAVFDPKDYIVNVKKPIGGSTKILPISNEDTIVITDPIEGVEPPENTVIISDPSATVDRPFKTVVSVVAEPKDQKTTFKEWNVTGVDITEEEKTEPTLSFVQPSNEVEIAAVFESNEFTVQIDAGLSKNGIAYIGSDPASRNSVQPAGATVIVNANPVDSTYRFVGWSSNDVNFVNSSATSTSFVMPRSDVLITFSFEKITSFLNLTVNDTSIGSALGGGKFEAGDNVELKAYPRAGYEISEWRILTTGVSIPELSTPDRIVNFLMPSQDVNIEAFFEEAKYNLEIIYDETIPGMTVSGGGLKKYDEDVVVQVNNAPASYGFVKWIYSVAGSDPIEFSSSSFFPSLPIDMPPADVTLELVLDVPSFEVSSTTLTGGTIEGLGSYKPNETVKLSVVSTDGYNYVSDSWVFVSGISQMDVTKSGSKKDVVEFLMPEENVEVSVVFTARPFNVTFNDVSNSNISYTSTSDPINPKTAESVSIDIEPAEGYSVVLNSLESDDVVFTSSTISTATFTMPPKDVEIKFELEGLELDVNFGIDPASGGGAGIVKGPSSAKVGDLITLTAQPNPGFVFTGWNISGCLNLTDAQKTSPTITFVMPGCQFNIEAVFDTPTISLSTSGPNITFEVFADSTLLTADSTETVDSVTTKSNFEIKYPKKIKVRAIAASGFEIDPSTWSTGSIRSSEITYKTTSQKDDTIEFYLPTSNTNITVESIVEVFTIFPEAYSNNLDSHPLYNDKLKIYPSELLWTGDGNHDAGKHVLVRHKSSHQLYNFKGFNFSRFSGISSSQYSVIEPTKDDIDQLYTGDDKRCADLEYNEQAISIPSMPANDVVIAFDFELNHCLHDVFDASPVKHYPHPYHYGLLSRGHMYLNHEWKLHHGRQFSDDIQLGGNLRSGYYGMLQQGALFGYVGTDSVFCNHVNPIISTTFGSDSTDNYIKMFDEDFKFSYSIDPSSSIATIDAVSEEQNKITFTQPGTFTVNMDFNSDYLGGGTFNNLSYHYANSSQTLDIRVHDDSDFYTFYSNPPFSENSNYSLVIEASNRISVVTGSKWAKEIGGSYSTWNVNWPTEIRTKDRSYLNNFSELEVSSRLQQERAATWTTHSNADQFGCSDDGKVFFNTLCPYERDSRPGISHSANSRDLRDWSTMAMIIRVFSWQGSYYEQSEPDIIFDAAPDAEYGAYTEHKVKISGDGKTIVATHQAYSYTGSSRINGLTRAYRLKLSSYFEYGVKREKREWVQVGGDIASTGEEISNLGISGDGNTIAIEYDYNRIVLHDYNKGTAVSNGDEGDSWDERQTIKILDLAGYDNDSKFSYHDGVFENFTFPPSVRRLTHHCNKLELDQDGSTIAIGLPNAIKTGGSVYVLNCAGSSWTQKGSKLTGDDLVPTPEAGGYFNGDSTDIKFDQFGKSISLSRDGNALAVGAPQLSAIDNPFASGDMVVIRHKDLDKIIKPDDLLEFEDGGRRGIQYIGDDGASAYEKGVHVRANYFEGRVVFPVFDKLDCLSINKSIMFNQTDRWLSSFEGMRATCSGEDCFINYKDFAVPEKSGYVKVFKFESNDWVSKGQKVIGENIGDGFGYSVSINNDATLLSVGAPYAYRYEKDYTTYFKHKSYVVPGACYLYHFKDLDSEWGMTCLPDTNTVTSCLNDAGAQGKNGLVHGNKGALEYLAKGITIDTLKPSISAYALWMQGSPTHTGLWANQQNFAHTAPIEFAHLKNAFGGYDDMWHGVRNFIKHQSHADLINSWGHLYISTIKPRLHVDNSWEQARYVELEVPKLKDVGSSFDINPTAYNSHNHTIPSGAIFKLSFTANYGSCQINIKSSSGSLIESLVVSNSKTTTVILYDGRYITVNGWDSCILRYSVQTLETADDDHKYYSSLPVYRTTNFKGGGADPNLTWSLASTTSLNAGDTVSLNASSNSTDIFYYMTASDADNPAIDTSSTDTKIRKIGTTEHTFYRVQGSSVTVNLEVYHYIFAYSPADLNYESRETEIKEIRVTDSVPRHKVLGYTEYGGTLEITPDPDPSTNGYASGTFITVKALPSEGRIVSGLDERSVKGFNGEGDYTIVSADTITFTMPSSLATYRYSNNPEPRSIYFIFNTIPAPTISWLTEYNTPLMAGIDDLDVVNDILDTSTGSPFDRTIIFESSDISVATVTNTRSWNSRTQKYDYTRSIHPISEGTVTITLAETDHPDLKIEKTITVIPFSYTDISFPAMANPEIYIMRSPEWWNGESWCISDPNLDTNGGAPSRPVSERFIIEKRDKIIYAQDSVAHMNVFLGGMQAGVDLSRMSLYWGESYAGDLKVPKYFSISHSDFIGSSDGYWEGARTGFTNSQNLDDFWIKDEDHYTSGSGRYFPRTPRRTLHFFTLAMDPVYDSDYRYRPSQVGTISPDSCANYNEIANTWSGPAVSYGENGDYYQSFTIYPANSRDRLSPDNNAAFNEKLKSINSFNLVIKKKPDDKYAAIDSASTTSLEAEEKFVIILSGNVNHRRYFWGWDPLPAALQVQGHDYIVSIGSAGYRMQIICDPNTPISISWPKAIRHGSGNGAVSTNEYNFSEWYQPGLVNQYFSSFGSNPAPNTDQQNFLDSIFTSGSNSKTNSSLEITIPEEIRGFMLNLEAQFIS